MNQGGGQVMSEHNHDDMSNTSSSTKIMKDMNKAEFMVSGNCGMCKSRIEKAAYSVQGVGHAVWDKDTKIMTIQFDGDKTNEEAVAKAISDVGHDTEFDKSLAENYDELPACCRYTREDR